LKIKVKRCKGAHENFDRPLCSLSALERARRMRIVFTSLPGFVTIVLRGMPNVWRGRHRLLLCWLIFMQAVSPGRKTLEIS
jgi:hypothetical protein